MSKDPDTTSPIKLSDVFGWLTNQLNIIRNVHFVLLILSSFCVATWLSIEPRNVKLENQFSALRDQMGISGTTGYSAYGFYKWIFSDQFGHHPLVGDYANDFWGQDFVPFDKHFAMRPANETVSETLNYLNKLAVKGVMWTTVHVDDDTRADFENWKRLAKEHGRSYSSEEFGFYPFMEPTQPRHMYVCFTWVRNRCHEVVTHKNSERLVSYKEPREVLQIPNAMDNNHFVLKGTLMPETLTLSPSVNFMNTNASEIVRFIKDNPGLKDARWDEVADQIFRPLLAPTAKRTLPLLGVDVGPRYLIPSWQV